MDGEIMTTPPRPQPVDPNIELNRRIKRRRVIALASASAAIGLASCGLLPSAPATSMSPEQQAANQKVHAFTSDIEGALDKVDRERLRAAAAAGSTPAVSESALVAHSKPDAAVAPQTPPSQAPVILASSSPAPGAAAPSEKKDEAVVAVKPAVAPAAEPSVAAPSSAAPAPTAPVAEHASAPAAPAAAAAASPTQSVAATAISGQAETAIIKPIAPLTSSTPSAMVSMNTSVASAANRADIATAAPTITAPTEPSLDDAIAVIRKNISAKPTLATALALSLLDGANATTPDTDLAKNLSEPDQQILTGLLSSLESMKPASPNATLADRAASLIDAVKKWQSEEDLSLPKLVLATRVDSFGVYTPIDSKFEQGKRHTVIIYCEVANFAAKKGDDGWFTTHLSQQETLITEDGLLVWRPNAEDVEDRSMNQRHDFYLVKKLTIPENLAAGKYTLRMSVTDKNTNKISMVSLPIELVSK